MSLKGHTPTQVRDFLRRTRDLDLSALSQVDQDFITTELLLSQIDFRYWLERYCVILAADKTYQPLEKLWNSQERLLSVLAREEEAQIARSGKAKIRAVILKARQLGLTALAQALLAHMTLLQHRTQAISASDDPENTRNNLYTPFLRIYDNLPLWMRPARDAKVKATNLHFPALDSDIMYGAGNQKTTLGQGMTVDCIHLSEVSTWLPECTDGVDSDLTPAFNSSRKHHSLWLIESTGSGAAGNWYHDQWKASNSKDSLFRPVFLAWFMRPDWAEDATGVVFEDTTLAMAARVQREAETELTREQLAWWQITRNDFKSKDKLDVFEQEFPSSAEEAFHSGFRSIFNIELRTRLRNEVRKPKMVWEWDPQAEVFLKENVHDWLLRDEESKYNQRLIIWEAKAPRATYVLGVDASHGIDGGDSSAIEVLRVGDRQRPDEQVAEWCGNISPVSVAPVAWKIGHWFNTDGFPAMMAVEVNPGSPGQVTQEELIRRRYPNFFRWMKPGRGDRKAGWVYGWHTTPGTRNYLTEGGVEALKKQWLLVNSIPFIKEMATYVNTGDLQRGMRKLEHAPGYHDDRIMALFIAYQAAHRDQLTTVAEQRRQADELKKQKVGDKGPELRDVRDFRDLTMTYEQAMDDFEDWISRNAFSG